MNVTDKDFYSNPQVVTEADRERMKTFTDMPALTGYDGYALNR